MKLIDEKGRLFKKINIFDLLVLLAFLIAVAAVGLKLIERNAARHQQVNTKTWVAQLKCPAMPDGFAVSLLDDTRLFFETDGFVNAKVIEAREEPSVMMVATSEGGLVKAFDPTLKDVYVTIEIQDDTRDEAVKVGRYAVCVGGKFTLKTVYAISTEAIVTELAQK